MKFDFRNKVVIVTGASSGIGQSCAAQAAAKGARVALVSRRKDKLQEVSDSIPGTEKIVIQADVGQEDQVRSMVDQVIRKFGQVDVLINNAGVGFKGSIITGPMDLYRDMLATNLFGVLHCIRAVYPHMKKQGGGTIVNVSSVAGIKGFYDCGLYSSSKFAVNGLTESFAEDARKDNIRVILICPGKVETNFEPNVLYRDEPYQNKRLGLCAEVVAKAIVDAIERNKRMVVIGKKCIPLYLLNRLSPGLTNMIIRKIY